METELIKIVILSAIFGAIYSLGTWKRQKVKEPFSPYKFTRTVVYGLVLGGLAGYLGVDMGGAEQIFLSGTAGYGAVLLDMALAQAWPYIKAPIVALCKRFKLKQWYGKGGPP